MADNSNDANNKAELLVRCIEQNLVTRLLLDRPTAAALVKKVNDLDGVPSNR